MGIAYLWDLLLACGKRVPLEFLKGKVLAIDASIWIVRADAVFGNTTLTIRSIFSKIITLMKIGVKPIFVFDGTPPSIKRNCLQLRRRRRLQFGEKEMKKLAQIQILKILKGQSQKPKKNKLQLREDIIQKEQDYQSDQQNIIQIQLKQAPTQQDNIKTQLYTELLVEKYKLMKQMYPHLFFKYNEQEFYNLNINQKVQVIEQIERDVYVEHKPRKIKNQSCQETLHRQLKVIKNKTRINELRDQIHRKLIEKIERNVNQEKNIQTVVGNYQGNTFKQVRRIQKKPLVNNIGQIFKKAINDEQKNQQQAQEIQQKQKEAERALPILKEGETFKSFLCDGFGGQDSPSEQIDDQFAFFNEQDNVGGQVNMKFNDPILQSQGKVQKQKQIQAKSQQNKEQPNQNHKQDENKAEQYPDFNQVYQAELSLNTEKANIQLKQLLQLLGLPYVLAPSEAEAQCAQLQRQGLVEGIITDDSDIFAFGGKNVYRGVFQNDLKYYGEIEFKKELKFSQEQFIIFALFTGSDYTDGVKGVGLVNAVEIIRPFNTFQKLAHFRQWAKTPDIFNPQNQQFYKTTDQEERKFFQYHKNIKNYWYVDQSFPNKDVIQAYLDPKIQTQLPKLQFKQPNMTILQKLIKQKLQLSQQQAEKKIKQLKEAFATIKMSHKKITDYFSIISQPIGRIRSKRLQNALK